MDSARYKAMDAQRFDPMRRTRNNPSSKIGISKLTMGQGLCIIHQPSTFPVRDTVGGIWPDHEVVVIPLSGADSDSGTSTSSSTSSSTSNPSPNACTSTPTLTDFVVVPPPHAQVNAHDQDDLVITRTIIRPNRPQPIVSSTSLSRSASSNRVNHFARPSHAPQSAPCSRATSRSPSRPSRPTSPVLQALNCFRSPSRFESDLANGYVEQDTQPALQVIVTQTREQFEDDAAFKQLVETVYPAAAAAGRV